MDIKIDDDVDLVLLQKRAKMTRTRAIHNKDAAVVETSSSSLARFRARLWSLLLHKIHGSSRHYIIAQVVILVAIGVVLVCFGCFRMLPATSPTLPNESWLDFREVGGVRHRVLEWPNKCHETKMQQKDRVESERREDASREPDFDAKKASKQDPLLNSLNKWYEAPEEPAVVVDPLADSLTDWYADGTPLPDGATPETKFHPLSEKAKDLEGPQLVPSKSAKLDSVHELDEDRKTVSSDRLVLFVHAASLCAGAWSPVVRRLENVTAIAFDQRGHGDTDAPPAVADYSWETIGQDFLRVVSSITARYGRAPDACVTHSFAGDCVLLALAKNPIPVGRLILLDPVLADAEGASVGAKRLADATRVCGQREVEGFGSAQEVGEHLERMLGPQLARGGLDAEAKEMYAMYASWRRPLAPDRWHLKCSRQNEAAIYESRLALADHLAGQFVDAEVHVVFAEKRRTAMSVSQNMAAVRDRRMADRVLKLCRQGSSLHDMSGVGHFMVLEAPELVAAKLEELLP